MTTRPPLPPLSTVSAIHQRLQLVFPEGTDQRNFVIRELAARTVFVMLYIGAIEDNDQWLRPNQVTRMTDSQSQITDASSRREWLSQSMRPSSGDIEGRWHAQDTRESIRDETLRNGLIRLGAVKVRPNIPTTSSLPRYALTREFAALFDPGLTGNQLESAIAEWQQANLTSQALARVAVISRVAAATQDRVLVTLPNGEVRSMSPGNSSIMSKAVAEDFAIRFLNDPVVLLLSESGNRLVHDDKELLDRIGLRIQEDQNLPDLILLDAGSDPAILVFVEVVATAGAITESRQSNLLKIATDAGFSENIVIFVSVFLDRTDDAFRRELASLAWRSFAWFVSEPENIVLMYGNQGTVQPPSLSDLMGN